MSSTLQGTILIAVNPLRKVEDPEMTTFMNHSLDPEQPHPYAIAEVRGTCCTSNKVVRYKLKNKFGFDLSPGSALLLYTGIFASSDVLVSRALVWF